MIQLDAYMREIFDFLKTVTIKNIYFADQFQTKHMTKHNLEILEDVDNPYYIKLTGVYTEYDTEMFVTSFDTNETILFSKANLVTHNKTKEMYKVGTYWYKKLCSQYPDQLDLIKAIIYPVTDIQKAISAKNYTILNYDETVLQANERDSIIEALENTMEFMRTRWDVIEFAYEECYSHAMWAVIWYHLPLVILTQRVTNLRTNAVHPFHIWEYLLSRGLKDYRTVLNIKQQLFLYRNLEYIYKNRGKNYILELLAKELLAGYNVLVRGKTILLNGNTVAASCNPSAEIISEEIFDVSTVLQDAEDGIDTIERVFNREYIDDLEPTYSTEEIANQSMTFSLNKSTCLPTKLIELKKQPLYGGYLPVFYRFILETMFYIISKRDAVFEISWHRIPPLDTPVALSPQETLALIYYTILKAYNVDAYYIPDRLKCVHMFKDGVITIPKTINRSGYSHEVETHIDTERLINSIPKFPAYVETPRALVEFIDGQFQSMYHHIMSVRSNNDTMFNYVFSCIYPNLLHNDIVEFQLVEQDVQVYTELYILDDTPYNRELVSLVDYINVKGVTTWAIARATSELSITGTETTLNGLLMARIVTESYVVFKDEPGDEQSVTDSDIILTKPNIIKTYDTITIDGSFDNKLLVRRHRPITVTEYGPWLVSGSITNGHVMSVPGSFKQWFTDQPDLQTIISYYDSLSDKVEQYENLTNVLISNILPLEYSSFSKALGLTSNYYKQMKNLLIQLCSYNIAFIDTDRLDYVYIRSALPTTHTGGTVDRLDVKYFQHIYNRFKHTTARVITWRYNDKTNLSYRPLNSSETITFQMGTIPTQNKVSKNNVYSLINHRALNNNMETSSSGSHRFVSISLKEE